MEVYIYVIYCCADVAKEALQRCMTVDCNESKFLSVEFDYCYICSSQTWSNAVCSRAVDDEKLEDNDDEKNSLTEYI